MMSKPKPGTMDARTWELFEFIRERYKIHVLKDVQNKPKPWTDDAILRQYRFCNVHREDDKVTKWIAQNWRMPHKQDPELWFAITVARFINWPDTLADIGYPVPFNQTAVLRKLQQRAASRKQVFTGAYIVSTNGIKCGKPEYVVDRVLRPLWADRKRMYCIIHDGDGSLDNRATLASVHAALSSYNGMGSFMAAQVIADLKYVPPLSNAPDWHTWAASGPGSRRGLLYVMEGGTVERNASWSENDWLLALQELHRRIDGLRRRFGSARIPPIHAQDLQNCLCEFSKYVRVQQGVGRPRSTYPGV